MTQFCCLPVPSKIKFSKELYLDKQILVYVNIIKFQYISFRCLSKYECCTSSSNENLPSKPYVHDGIAMVEYQLSQMTRGTTNLQTTDSPLVYPTLQESPPATASNFLMKETRHLKTAMVVNVY